MAEREHYGALAVIHLNDPDSKSGQQGRIIDWGFLEDGDSEPQRLRAGSLVKVFKGVTNGKILFDGTLRLQEKYSRLPLQIGIEPDAWAGLFHSKRPARLEQGGQEIFGHLGSWSEQGIGPVAALFPYGDDRLQEMRELKTGDRLTVYSLIRDGEIDWQGFAEFGPDTVEDYGHIGILRATKHAPTKNWLQRCEQKQPCIIVPPDNGPL